jgi:hypothetical protein
MREGSSDTPPGCLRRGGEGALLLVREAWDAQWLRTKKTQNLGVKTSLDPVAK